MRLLELHFAQISKIWDRSKNNYYSDKSKSAYHARLKLLYEKLAKESHLKDTDKTEIKEKRAVLGFFADSVTFLDNSTVTSLPFELVRCLELALNEWSKGDDYIIVTTLAKGLNSFSFDPKLAINDSLYEVIEKNYGIDFPQRLIQISVPEYLVGDYLANVVLYHELGHFIEIKYSLPDVITKEFLDDFSNKKIKEDFYTYFPFIRKIIEKGPDAIYSEEALDQLKMHIGEYFCDLFASQYVSDSVNHYLTYISEVDYTTRTHPPTSLRVKLVYKFLKGQKSYVLDKFEFATKQMVGEELKKRHGLLATTDIENFLPANLNNENELHSLFNLGWSLWLGDWHKFRASNNMKYSLTGYKIYGIINDLIEKSIGNFIVQDTWKKVKNVSSKKRVKKEA